ncbi:MAG: hypothetical protein IT210_23265 [Armatimonadetes bacterium]|nr:hypothetical protein [Armatimonadota bacterium]
MPMTDQELDELVRESIDMHVHTGPDILPRKYTVHDLVEDQKGKIRGAALKVHSFPSIPEIIAEQENNKNDMALVGGITLNYFMGGFNPSAIYASSVMSGKYPILVWFPTVHAKNHLMHNKSPYEIPPEWVGDPNFKPRLKKELKAISVMDWNDELFDKCIKVLDTIQQTGSIMGTGHLSSKEAEVLTLEGLKRGIKVIVTHPDQRDIAMPLDTQIRLALRGAYIEYCYIMWLDRDNPEDYPLDEMAHRIKAVGPEHCILSSDCGQLRNPSPSECLREFVRLLEKEGLTRSDFEQMLIHNPRKLIGMD